MLSKVKTVLLRDWGLFLILAVSAGARAVSAFVIVGESGGDFYNYLLMAKSFLGGGSLFIEKRLPVYALLLIPGHLAGHPLGYARVLGIALALLTLYFLYRLLLDLRLPKAVALTSLILLSFQPTFFIFSIRPLSHTLFDLEVIFCLFLFYKLTRGLVSTSNFTKARIWQFVAFGLCLGLTAMTRHEGFLVAGALVASLVIYMLRRGSNYWFPAFAGMTGLIGTFGLAVLPWFISNYQRFGNPFYTQYQADAGLNVAYTPEKLLGNAIRMRDIFLGLWGNLGFVSVREPWLIITRLTSLNEIITVMTIILMIVGLIVFIRRLRWAAIPTILVFLTQAAFLTVVQPWPRHSQQIFFVPAVFLALGLYWLASLRLGRVTGILTLILLTPVWIYLATEDQAALMGYVTGGQATLPLRHSLETLQRQFPDGKVLVPEKYKDGLADEHSLVEYYLGNRITYSPSDNPKYILDYNGFIETR